MASTADETSHNALIYREFAVCQNRARILISVTEETGATRLSQGVLLA
jgi:hypothetical protein